MRGEFGALRRNDVFRTYVGLIAVMYILFVIGITTQGTYEGWEDLTIDPLFQIVSTMTSTGFTPSNFEQWGPLVLALVFMLMLFGACAGSTSGGAKIDRLLFLVKNCRNELYRCIYPHAIMSVRVNGKVVSLRRSAPNSPRKLRYMSEKFTPPTNMNIVSTTFTYMELNAAMPSLRVE